MFKQLEMFFLVASPKIRWCCTFLLLAGISAFWYVWAFVPLQSQVKTLRHKLENASTLSQEASQQEVIDSLNHKVVSQRLSFVGGYHDFLKDLLKNDLTTTTVTVDKIEKIDGYTATSLTLSFKGSFEKFYHFLNEHQKNYLCHWNSCTCTKSPDGLLSIQATIIIYSK